MITKADPGVWCDYCKSRWGRVREGWHPKATTQATVIIHSFNPKSNVTKRHYCAGCALDVTSFTGTKNIGAYNWGLADQIATMLFSQLEIEG